MVVAFDRPESTENKWRCGGAPTGKLPSARVRPLICTFRSVSKELPAYNEPTAWFVCPKPKSNHAELLTAER